MLATSTATVLGDGPQARHRTVSLVDVALAAAVLAGTLTQLAHGGVGPFETGDGLDPSRRGPFGLDATGVTLATCTALPLLGWRRSPFGVFTVTAAACVPLAALGYPLDLTIGPAIALYLVSSWRDDRLTWSTGTVVAVVGLFAAYLGAVAVGRDAFPGTQLLHSGMAWAAAWFAGERTRLRREHMTELDERARRAELDAERERRLAAAEERARIARDLHDSAGHAISVIAVRAGAARLRHHDDPARSLAALETIEQLARHTGEEIDRIVGRLRDAETTGGEREIPRASVVEAPPGLASLDTLVAQHADTGFDVVVETRGTSQPLNATADQAVYRILQEALTNASRHGAGRAHVELDFGEDAVGLTVTNPVRHDAPPRPGGGHGLVGMRERAQLLGGELRISRANGTFRLHAWIPAGDWSG